MAQIILFTEPKERKKRDLQTQINADIYLLKQPLNLLKREQDSVYRRLAKNSAKFSELIG